MDHLFNEPILFDCSNQIQPYQCEKCLNFQTNFSASVRRHISSGHRNDILFEETYKCLRCSFLTFSGLHNLRHSFFSGCATRDEDKPKKGFVCSPDERSTFSLKNEPITSLQESRADVEVVKSESCIKSEQSIIEPSFSACNWWYCTQCLFKCQDRSILFRHTASCHPKSEDINKRFSCDQCSCKYKWKDTLDAHVKNAHPKPKPEDILLLECAWCPNKYKSQTSLKRHIKSKHLKTEEIRWFKCDHCDFKTRIRGNLKRHNICRHPMTCSHLSPEHFQRFVCDQCFTQFTQKASLKRHIMTCHCKPEDIQWFGCVHCSYQSRSTANLKRHISTHQT